MTAITETPGQLTATPEVTAATRGASMIATIATVSMRGVRRYMRTPQLLVFSVISVVIFLVLFRYIFGGAIHLGSLRYVEFLVVRHEALLSRMEVEDLRLLAVAAVG